MSERKTLDVKELAEAFGVSAQCVRRQAQRGHIPAMRIGRKFVFDPKAVAIALSNQARKPHKKGNNPK